MTELTTDLKTSLNKSLRTLGDDISRVEGELDLELENLGDLLDQRHPEVSRQLQALNGSIQQLHRSLAEVRSQLTTAQAETAELHETLENAQEAPEAQAASPETTDEPALSPSTAEQERHSSSVTLGSILRGLLMAEEPGQRHEDQGDNSRE